MLLVNYATLIDDMESYFDKVTDHDETIVVTRKNNKSVVIISEETYNNLMENIYLTENKTNYNWLLQSKMQLEQGHCSDHIIR